MAEIAEFNGFGFSSYEALYRRLGKLRAAGFLKRGRMLWNGEFYYYLGVAGKAWLKENEGLALAPRSTRPCKAITQQHEFEVSRFMIRFLTDCQRLKIPVLSFWRDGEFAAVVRPVDGKTSKLIPDGTVVLKIKGKARVFFLELDRGTETSGVDQTGKGVFRRKLKLYQSYLQVCHRHPFLKGFDIHSSRVVTVCRSQARLEFLRVIAGEERLRKGAAFTCWPRLVEVSNSTAQGWQYLSPNFLAAPLFSFPGRSPPRSLLS